MANRFQAMDLQALCNVRISNLNPEEIRLYHRELIVRQEKLEGKLIGEGIDPKVFDNKTVATTVEENVFYWGKIAGIINHLK